MILILMGVTGSGKSTLGKLLSERLGWSFHDADDFHPASNIAKMRQGIPLNDDDRRPWLLAIQKFMREALAEGRNAIIACSALRASYRELLLAGDPGVRFVHLKGNRDLIRDRLESRQGHFMNPKLLDSQFQTLEEPDSSWAVEVNQPPEAIAAEIEKRLGLR
jgi:gluconokinase